MKNGLLVGTLVALAGIFAFANAPAYAQQDLNLTSAKADITYETASECLTPPQFSNPVVSCNFYYLPWNSDTFEINANVDTTLQTDLSQELTSVGMFVALAPGSCGDDNAPVYVGFIPALSQTSNKNWDIYAFEGAVPDTNFSIEEFFPLFSDVEAQIKVDKNNPADSTLHLEGNGNLCNFDAGDTPVTGQMCLFVDNAGAISGFGPDFYDGLSETDGDYSEVTVTPEYSNKDISTAFCPLFFE